MKKILATADKEIKQIIFSSMNTARLFPLPMQDISPWMNGWGAGRSTAPRA